MQTSDSLKFAERRAFQTTFADGLWDVLIGSFVLEFAIAPLLSTALGDFWSSAVFLPFWGLIYLAIQLTRKYVLAPRVGSARYGKARQQRLRRFSLVMIAINILALILGILTLLTIERPIDGLRTGLFGFILMAGFSLAAYLLDFPRLYVYGLLLLLAPPVGEWLYANHGVAHHGFPVVFGFVSGVMILTGLFLFVRLLINNPVVDGEGA